MSFRVDEIDEESVVSLTFSVNRKQLLGGAIKDFILVHFITNCIHGGRRCVI